MSHGIWREECGQVSGRAWSCEPESLHYFSPECDAQLFLQTIVHMADWHGPKLQVLHAVGKSASQNRFSGPIPYYLETENLISLGSSDLPWSNQPGTGEVQGRERGGFTAQLQLNPCVNKGHRAGRESKYAALKHWQNGPPRRQKVNRRVNDRQLKKQHGLWSHTGRNSNYGSATYLCDLVKII